MPFGALANALGFTSRPHLGHISQDLRRDLISGVLGQFEMLGKTMCTLLL